MVPDISLILPAYNCSATIRETIVSVQHQSFLNWELIIVDDGSTDSTGSICDAISENDDRVRVIHKSNEGVSRARNIGIKAAKGIFVGFIDGDDILNPNALYREMLNVEENGILIFGYETFPQMGRRSVEKEKTYKSCDEFALDYSYLASHNLINSIWNKLYRRDIISKYFLGFPEDVSMGEDLIFNLSYLKVCGSIKVIPDILYKYRIENDSSLSKKISRDSYEVQKKLKKCLTEVMGKTELIKQYIDYDFVLVVWGQMKSLVYSNNYNKNEKIIILKDWLEDSVFQESFQSSHKVLPINRLYIELIYRKNVIIIYNLFRCRFYLSRFLHSRKTA